MSDIEKIRQEIERRRDFFYERYIQKGMGCIEETRYDECVEILSFIDSLPDCTVKTNGQGRVKDDVYDSLSDGTCKDSLQIQETCKENQDSFTDEPKEMSVDEAMAYLDEKIAKARASKSWEGVDVDKFLDEIRGREPDDLEKAAENYIAPIENDEGLDYINFNGRDIKDAFIAGAKWMESQTPMPEDTVIFMKGVKEGWRLERKDRNDDNLPRYYGD